MRRVRSTVAASSGPGTKSPLRRRSNGAAISANPNPTEAWVTAPRKLMAMATPTWTKLIGIRSS
jgi:hypothetical protein